MRSQCQEEEDVEEGRRDHMLWECISARPEWKEATIVSGCLPTKVLGRKPF